MFKPEWRTTNVVAIAQHIRESRDYGILNILADALQDAGCDDPTLAALRDEGIADSRSGLWLAGCLDLQKGPCPTCRDSGRVIFESVYGCSANYADCPTCPTRERWDRCPCPAPNHSSSFECQICRDTRDLLKFREEDIGPGGPHSWYDQTRPLDFSLGPLPVVSARVEEIGREQECRTCKGGRFPYPDPCPSCSGTGRTWVPSEWLRSLPEWLDVTLEGVEPFQSEVTPPSWWEDVDEPDRRGHLPKWAFDFVWHASLPEQRKRDGIGRWVVFPSPTAARLELCRAVRRWRFTSS